MGDDATGMLHIVTHDSTVHATLLMDLLRIAHQLDPAVFQQQVDRAERDLQEANADPRSPLHGHASHSVLEHRLAFLRSVQIQASVA